MTDNDAAKALERLRTKICLLPTAMQKQAQIDIETLRTALARSAKVDGLLAALRKIFQCQTASAEIEEIADEAIQRFNGEV